MKKVELIGPGLKLNNSWYWCGDVVYVSEAEYEKNKSFLKVIEDIKEKQNINNLIKNDNEDTNINNNIDEKNNTGTDKNTNENEMTNNDTILNDDEELEILREKAKELGIANAHLMKKETLLAKISEAEKNNE